MKKVVLISGGTKGIGLATCLRLLDEGCRVVVFSRNTQVDSDVLKKYNEEDYLVLKGDVMNEGDVENIIIQVKDKFGRIDVVVNNAGFGYFAESDKVDIKKFEEMLAVNVVGVANLVKHAVPVMKENKNGLIITIASVSGKVASKEGEFYNATKFGIIGYCKGLRLELKPYNIRVAIVNPGMVKTEFFTEEVLKERCRHFGMSYPPPMLEASDIAGAIAYIISQPDSVEIQDIDIMPF